MTRLPWLFKLFNRPKEVNLECTSKPVVCWFAMHVTYKWPTSCLSRQLESDEKDIRFWLSLLSLMNSTDGDLFLFCRIIEFLSFISSLLNLHRERWLFERLAFTFLAELAESFTWSYRAVPYILSHISRCCHPSSFLPFDSCMYFCCHLYRIFNWLF